MEHRVEDKQDTLLDTHTHLFASQAQNLYQSLCHMNYWQNQELHSPHNNLILFLSLAPFHLVPYDLLLA
jgi:hypothetical protein